MSYPEADGSPPTIYNDEDRKNNFVKALPKSRIAGLVRGLLLHASTPSLDYRGRRKSLDSLQTIIGYHAAEITQRSLVELILRGASTIIAAGCHGSHEQDPLFHSAGAVVLTLGSKIEKVHLLPLMVTIVEEYATSADDHHRHCAMIHIGNCINFYGNDIGPSTDRFWVHLISGLRDISAEVRQAACFSLGFWIVNFNPEKRMASQVVGVVPTILRLCRDSYISVAACTVLIPLMERGLIQGYDHDIMVLSSRLLETLPQSFKFLSIKVMGCAAISFGVRFLPYLHSCMRRISDFSARYEQADTGLRLMVMSAITSFAKTAGKEVFHPYLGDSIHNVLRGLSMDPPQLTECGLSFLGSMAQLYDVDFSEHLSEITGAICKLVLADLTGHEEEALASTILQIIRGTRDNVFAFGESYLDTLQILSHRPRPGVRQTAIHALFHLTSTLRDIRTSEGELRFCLETRAKHILLNANTSEIKIATFLYQQPVKSDKSLILDIILSAMNRETGPQGYFPASVLLYSTTTRLSKSATLDLSQFLPVLLARCGPQYCFQVQDHAFETIADVLRTTDEASWVAVEPLVLQLMVRLYQGLRYGSVRFRSAIVAIGQITGRTRFDLSMLYPSLFPYFCHALLGPGLPDSTVKVATSTLSLIIRKQPSAVWGRLATSALVTSLTYSLDVEGVIMVFEGLKNILGISRTWRTVHLTPCLVQGLLLSYARIIDDPQVVINISAVTQTLICVLFRAGVYELQDRSFYVELSQNKLKIAVDGNVSHEIQLALPLDKPLEYPPSVSTSRWCHTTTPPTYIPSFLKVPPEIIAQIVALCLPEGRDWDVAGAEGIPYILGQINHKWRQIVQYTPKIWDSLDIELTPGIHEIRSRRIVSAVEIWLERTGGLPITISVCCLAAGSSTFHSNLGRLVRTLVQFSRFWKDLQLHVPFPALQEFYIAHRSFLDMPRLHNLSLISSTFGFEPGQSPLCVQSAPLLQVLTLRHVGLQLDVLDIPWNQLTWLSLKVTGWTAKQCVHALKNCRQLKFLHLNAVWTPQERYEGEKISLPSLEILHMNHGLSHLLPSLDLPHIHELKTEHPGFSTTLKWINSGFILFLSALSAFKERGVIPPTSINKLRRDRQDRSFVFTILDSTVLDSIPLSRLLPSLGTLAQYMGMVVIDCSLCTDQTILDVVAYVKQEVFFSPVYNVHILVHRAGGEAITTHLVSSSQGHDELTVEMVELGLEIHFSRSTSLCSR